jgi:hypothetical protein
MFRGGAIDACEVGAALYRGGSLRDWWWLPGVAMVEKIMRSIRLSGRSDMPGGSGHHHVCAALTMIRIDL